MIHLATVASVIASQRGVAPAPVIDFNDASQRDYWTYRLNVSHDALLAAIDKVGPSVAAVLRDLRK
jgi:uncharacterized protein DUF3606